MFPFPHNVFIIQHPVLLAKITRLRSSESDACQFRRLIREASYLLGYEAARDLESAPLEVQTPDALVTGSRLSGKIGLAPILRAGLPMQDGFLDLLPNAHVWHVGVWQGGREAKHYEYYNRLRVERPDLEVGIVLDPILKTGGSARLAIEAFYAIGVPKVKFVGLVGTEGAICSLQANYPELQIYLALIEAVNERNWIPGWGDVGDRAWGT